MLENKINNAKLNKLVNEYYQAWLIYKISRDKKRDKKIDKMCKLFKYGKV